MKKYIFILCPPFQGSTILTNLLNSSKFTTTFCKNNNVCEGLYEYGKKIDKYWWNNNRWDVNYKLDMDKIKELYDKLWQSNENTIYYVEKAPCMIARANEFQEYFSKFGEVFFIVSIRNPYSVRKNYGMKYWLKYTKYQKENVENLENVLVTSYEELCLNLPNFKSKLKKFLPELSDICNNDSHIKKKNVNERQEKIHDIKVNRRIDVSKKNTVLRDNQELLKFFNYEILKN